MAAKKAPASKKKVAASAKKKVATRKKKTPTLPLPVPPLPTAVDTEDNQQQFRGNSFISGNTFEGQRSSVFIDRLSAYNEGLRRMANLIKRLSISQSNFSGDKPVTPLVTIINPDTPIALQFVELNMWLEEYNTLLEDIVDSSEKYI